MGVDIQPVSSVPAGNVCGIAGLDAVVLKFATLSSLPPPLSPFLPLSFQSAPIMRVAVEPQRAADFPALLRGLRLLAHADPNVLITQTERGETVLVVSGELHLERCLRDLHDRFALGVAVNVSEPLVAFRETVVREDDSKKGDVDFRLKKERERDRKGREKGKKRRDDDGEEENSGAARDGLKEGEKRRAREAEDRRRREKEERTAAEAAGSSALSVPVDRDVAASPSPTPEDEGSHVDASSASLDPLSALHQHEVEEWTPGREAMLRLRCVPLGAEVMTLLEEGRHLLRRMARKRQREERRHRETEAEKPPDADEQKQPQHSAAAPGSLSDAVDPVADPATAASTDSHSQQGSAAPRLAEEEEEQEEEEDAAAANEDEIIASRCVNKFTPASFVAALRALFGSASCPELTAEDVAHIWSFGPARVGPNLLINRTDLAPLTSFFSSPVTARAAAAAVDPARLGVFRQIESGIVNGFQLAASAGPLCEEPMMGVAFVVSHLSLQPWESATAAAGSPVPSPSPAAPSASSLPGQIISTARSACRRSFLSHRHHLRLLEALYLVHLQCATSEIGRLYPVLSRRRCRVVREEMQDGANLFLVTALLPLADSFGFSSELREATGGEAQPQLIFSHWELMLDDPFHQPRTEEEIERSGVVEEGRNVAKEWLERVRKRKGLHVQEKVVEHAEKQRTLARKK